MKFGLYTISYGGERRAKGATTPRIIPQISIVTRNSDVDAYKAEFPNNQVIGLPDEFFGFDHDLYNRIREFGDDVACVMDDDLKSVCIFRSMEKITDCTELIYDKIVDIAQIVYDLKVPFGTTSNDLRPYGRNKLFSPVCTPGGISFYNYTVTEPEDLKHRSEECGMFSDTDKVIRMLAKYRLIFCFNHIVFHFDLQGANTTDSYSAQVMDCVANMKLKYGKYFSYSPSKKSTTINVKR